MNKEEKAIKVLSDPKKWNNYLVNEIEQACKVGTNAIEKLSKIEQIMNATEYVENGAIYSYCYNQERKVNEIREVLKNG